MRIILTGGITGGHIYPALAIGDKFVEKDPSTEILYLGHEEGLETTIVPDHGYDLKLITAKWVDRSNVLKMADTLISTERGKRQSYRIMKSFKPDIIMSTGSFVSVPVVLAAEKYGAKVFIHEQNAFPGMANKFLAKYAETVFLGFSMGARYFKEQDKLIYSGNPVRKDFMGRDRSSERAKLGIPEDAFVILVFGGSLGASTINEVGKAIIEAHADNEKVYVLFGTGKHYYDKVREELRQQGYEGRGNIRVAPYIDDMAAYLGACDVVISRSGALSVSEITMAGRAGIFIPSPNVTGDHQYYNAKAIVDRGGGIIISEDDDTAVKVLNTLKELMTEPDLLREMEAHSFECAPVNATDIIYENIMKKLNG